MLSACWEFVAYTPPNAIGNRRSRSPLPPGSTSRLARRMPSTASNCARGTQVSPCGPVPERVPAGTLTGMVFVADDLAAWLIGAARRCPLCKKLTAIVVGTDQERALRSAATAAVQRPPGRCAQMMRAGRDAGKAGQPGLHQGARAGRADGGVCDPARGAPGGIAVRLAAVDDIGPAAAPGQAPRAWVRCLARRWPSG